MPNAALGLLASGSRVALTRPCPTSTGVSLASRSSNLTSAPTGWIDLVGRNNPERPTFAANRCAIVSTSS